MKKALNNKSEFVSRSFSDYHVEENTICGIPIVFEQPTNIGGYFEETIARNAIDPSILQDVDLFYNHDLNTKPIARTKNGKLKLEIKDDGVHMVAHVNRERSDVNDLYLAIQDGDIDGMSFMFRVSEDEWTGLDTDYPKRRITKIDSIREVSAVNSPAYVGTSINARSNNQSILENARAKIESNNDSLELEKLKAKYLFNI